MISFDYAAAIKERVSIKEVLSAYGYEINRAGYISCPFHSEKTASCKVYENRFHCFGCGTDGDIFTFTERLFDIDFKQALVRINEDFHLGLELDGEASPEAKREAAERLKQKKKAQREKQRKDKAYMEKSIKFRSCLYALYEFKPPTEFDFLHPDFVYALNNIERLRYELDCEL